MEIPSINNPIWKDLIISFENLELKSLAFQMIVIRTKERFRNKEISIENAIEILYNFCINNKKGNNLIVDIKNIFGDSEINIKFNIEKPQKMEEDIEIDENIIVPDNLLGVNDIERDTNIKTKESTLEEKEKLLHDLESLDNKVKEIDKKKKKGFFKRLFIY